MLKLMTLAYTRFAKRTRYKESKVIETPLIFLI